MKAIKCDKCGKFEEGEGRDTFDIGKTIIDDTNSEDIIINVSAFSISKTICSGCHKEIEKKLKQIFEWVKEKEEMK